jgi:hypothetical protein
VGGKSCLNIPVKVSYNETIFSNQYGLDLAAKGQKFDTQQFGVMWRQLGKEKQQVSH